jgi:hypothetical protein
MGAEGGVEPRGQAYETYWSTAHSLQLQIGKIESVRVTGPGITEGAASGAT